MTETLPIRIRVVTTGHYEDKGDEASVLVFANDETDSEIAEALGELYCLTDEEGISPPQTLDEVTEHIGDFAWWSIDDRTIEINLERKEKDTSSPSKPALVRWNNAGYWDVFKPTGGLLASYCFERDASQKAEATYDYVRFEGRESLETADIVVTD